MSFLQTSAMMGQNVHACHMHATLDWLALAWRIMPRGLCDRTPKGMCKDLRLDDVCAIEVTEVSQGHSKS